MSSRFSTLPHRLARLGLAASAILLGATLAAWLDREGYIAFKHDPAPAPFRDGDVVCFLGDSITEDGRFIGYLAAFYLTRFPERRIEFVNTGTAGDSVGDARRRLAWDVLPHVPTVVSVMFGMNDVRRRHYDPANRDPDRFAARVEALENFEWNLDVLAAQLSAQATRPEIVLTTSSPYDETALLEAPSFIGVNDALARTRPIVARLARKHRARFIDLHSPLATFNARVQAASPGASIVGEDRIHPGAAGHLLLASHYLLAQNVPAIVSHLSIDASQPANTTVIRAHNARVRALSFSDGRLAFESEEFALPFPVDPAAQDVLTWFPFHETLNLQILSVSLPDNARYRLLIDTALIGDFSAAELRAGINLAHFSHTPQNRQSQALLTTLDRRRLLDIQLRRLAHVRSLLHNANLDHTDDSAVESFFARRLAQPQRNHSAYFESLFSDYRSLRSAVEEIESERAKLTAAIYQLNQPVPHRYELIQIQKDEIAVR